MLSNKTALIVDDRSNWRKILKNLLSKDEINVEEAENFEIAKHKLINNQYDLVILDVRLEENSLFNDQEGISLLREVINKSPNTKTIVMTGYLTDLKEKPKCDKFIDKSKFTRKDFISCFRELLSFEKKYV